MASFEYPIAWPPAFPRTPPAERECDRFGKRNDRGWLAPLTVNQSYKRLMAEISTFTRRGESWRINPDDVVISTMLRVRHSDNMPQSAQCDPADPGVAVYFELDEDSYCLPCDKWASVAGNLAAVAAHLNAIRGIERWGVGDLRAQFKGFQALPDPNRVIWRDVFGCSPNERPAEDALVKLYRTLRSEYHPDKGGTAAEFDRINKAWRLACEELGYSNNS